MEDFVRRARIYLQRLRDYTEEEREKARVLLEVTHGKDALNACESRKFFEEVTA